MKRTALMVVLALVFTTVLPLAVNAEEQEKDSYNEFGIKEGTEVFGIDISELSEEELQYVPEGWRDGVIEDVHPEAAEENDAQLQASYPNVNQYIKNKKYKVPSIEYSYINHFPKFGYRNGVGAVEGVVAHETANNKSTITSEIQYMSRNYYNAFVHSFVNDDRIIEIHPTNYAAWGAGPVANQRFIHVELVRVHSYDEFARSINNYSYYIAKLLFDNNLGVTDAERTGKGTLWSHKAVSTHLGGTNHVDPHGYFNQYGYNWNEFVKLVKEKYDSFGLPRVSGNDRYHTSVQVSQKGWKTASTVFVSRGDDYSDALAGVPLAKKYNAPLLMTQSSRLTNVTKKELQRLGTKKVFILGGEIAIGNGVVSELKKMGITVERISGNNRIETAIKIGEQVLAGSSKKEVVFVNALNFADALSVAPYAAQKGIPILLTRPEEHSNENKKFMEENNITKSYIIGGPLAVSKKVGEKLLPDVKRIQGGNRYATAVEVAKYFKPNAKDFYLTTGLDFPDSLSAATLAAKENKGLLLVPNFVPKEVKKYIDARNPNNLTIVGGTIAITKNVERELKRIMN